MILFVASLLGEKEPPDGLIGCQRFRRFGARGGGDRSSEHAIDVGHRDDDMIGDFVLQREDALRLPVAIERLGPKVRSGISVHQLRRDTQLVSRLAQASLHEVARTQFVSRFCARRRIRRDNAQSNFVQLRGGKENATRPVTISSVSPSANTAISALIPLNLNGSTAIQNPSSRRTSASALAGSSRSPLEHR